MAVAIVGRDPELAAVERLVDAISERSTALVIEGEAGIGKTTVWQEPGTQTKSGPSPKT